MRDEDLITMFESTRQEPLRFDRTREFLSGLIDTVGHSIQTGLEGVDRFGDVILDETIHLGGGLLKIVGNILRKGLKPVQYIDGALTQAYGIPFLPKNEYGADQVELANQQIRNGQIFS